MSQRTASGPEEERSSFHGDSILDAIARRGERVPQVNLNDAGTGGEAPIIDPKARDFQKELSTVDQRKYRVLGEIARGGMGVVLRGHDVELGRDIAIKVTDAELAKRPEVIERFIEEAQIGGQLQHPGIVPVYELGVMADQRPFFTMKLIKGRTLAAMLTRRKSIEEDRTRFLGIWESVCQTMAYAHSKGVIHRDLKPANIMVGAFGEVQVVDWGLSKVLQRGGVADEIEARDTALSVIETVRSGPGSGSGSMVGSVLGTPAYMSPEQAQGEPDKLDERTDVFSLGAILCEILTGSPPYVADGDRNLVQMAALAELDGARSRIEECSASPDLKRLCLASLMIARAARPSDSGDLATAVHAHLAGLESRAHEAQLAAAEERLRAERSRRRLQLTVLMGVVLMLAGGGWWSFGEQRRQRMEELSKSFDSVQSDATALQREGDFATALEVARGGLQLVRAGSKSGALIERASRLVETTEAALGDERKRLVELARERALLDFLLDVEMRQVRTGFDETDAELDAQYTAAFGTYGLDLDAADLGDRLLALQDTDLGVRLALGFDGWARLLRRMGTREFKLDLLTGIGIDLDSDPLRTAVRWALVERQAEQLLQMSNEVDVDSTPPETLVLLATSLRELDHLAPARALYVRGANRHPTSFLLNFGAGRALFWPGWGSKPDAFDASVGYLQAALTLRPNLTGLRALLSDLYHARGDIVMATHHLDLAIAATPDHDWNEVMIAQLRFHCGQFEEALDWYERGVNSAPPDSGFYMRACNVALGKTSIDELLVWGEAEAKAGNPWGALGPAMVLIYPGLARQQPDFARARVLLEPFLERGFSEKFADATLYDALAWIGLALDDLPLTLKAIERCRQHEATLVDRQDLALILLRDSVVARMRGDAAASRGLVAQARRMRDELLAGMEAQWQHTGFLIDFRYLETIATER